MCGIDPIHQQRQVMQAVAAQKAAIAQRGGKTVLGVIFVPRIRGMAVIVAGRTRIPPVPRRVASNG